MTKSNCMVIGKNILQQLPTFSICSEEMKIVNSVNLLGSIYDVNLISATATGLHVLLDICGKYADKWRMRFNVTKSNCIVIGKNILQQLPTFSICSEEMKIVNSVILLGVNIKVTLAITLLHPGEYN